MPKILPLYQQQRQRTGNHTNWQDKRLGTQKTQNESVQRLASRPGLHTKNISRQNTAHAMLQLISMLSAVQYNNLKTTRSTIEPNEASVLRNSITPFSESGYIKQTLLNERPITMLSWLTGLLYQADTFIIRNDPLRFPGAHALPIKENKTMNSDSSGISSIERRKPRYVPLPTESTTTTFVTDDVKIEKMHDFSCMNNGDDLSTAQIFRQIGESLQNPITMMTESIEDIFSWIEGQGCASPETVNSVRDITKKIDAITSQIITLLPGSKPLAVLQYIVGPLLERAANDLEGKSTPLSNELALLQQINLETRMSYNMILDRDKEILKSIPAADQKSVKIELPEFHITDSKSELYIDLNNNGKAQRFPVTFNEKNGRIHAIESIGPKGEVKLHQVYYNFMTKKWERTGNGRFNHFSKKERRLAQKLGLRIDNNYPSSFNDKAATYSVINPYFSEPKRLNVIMMFGHLVPYRYELNTGKTFIYDASAPERGELHEIVLTQGEWHLKTIPDTNIKIETLYSPQHSRHLNVAVVDFKNGQKIFAQYNSDASYFWGEKFVLNEEGDLEEIQVNLRHKGWRGKGDTAGESSQSVFNTPEKIRVINKASVRYMDVYKNRISDSDYIQYYTKCLPNEKGSETLVLSAHGGYTKSDKKTPVVAMPPEITIQLLTPHRTKLLDPGLDNVVNAGKDLRAYVTIKDNQVVNVHFLPQNGNPDWLKNYDLVEASPYNPESKKHTLGRGAGLQNIRHVNFEGESDHMIARVIEKNRRLAKEAKADLTDVLTVSHVINDFSKTSLDKHSIQAVLDLDKTGKLVNAKGERYKKIIFSHCREDLSSSEEISSYIMIPEDLNEIKKLSGLGRPKGMDLKITELYREDVTHAFEIRHHNVGRFILIPAKQKTMSTMAPSLS